MSRQQQACEEIIIFTRYPEPGNVKTRLVPFLGKEEAARLHRLLAERIIARVLTLEEMRPVRISLHYTGSTRSRMEEWLGRRILLEEQSGSDVGRRMDASLGAACARGTARTVLIGTDCPAMSPGLLARALDRLRTRQVVLGPAWDGGYYLVGVNRTLDPGQRRLLFEDIDWGTPGVYHQTVQKIMRAGIPFTVVSTLNDIDRPEDLAYFSHYTNP
jgi:hypothetical protein